ncbi:hypothetical protein ASPWEDRAFT_305066 [Aspergillus wentii DTO 134E9]|uniref:Uncharacterized protein n=1 Tax=Aspergillus wentii DTO 134E9 TaxID=1073089 RepID=A0A1L9R3S0_ASPWE|nr:uncharacterized protein ASPWEDRAFT_306259 [Aspergillus wentii DTO 134E9]XP_040683319.1 uncharacterized protein ASPWEDRAFT_305066 [Aspergillus wentii DTO 134E9]OJJ29554.1 hypothetical protein ASPWEDRAFT_306259 [Aspergillus wentii DTO 134E9]OJJ29642.1 hypothetical protein ASPWEDRAFT_305066 [Aspergillus wentii DTO 134E9]
MDLLLYLILNAASKISLAIKYVDSIFPHYGMQSTETHPRKPSRPLSINQATHSCPFLGPKAYLMSWQYPRITVKC